MKHGPESLIAQAAYHLRLHHEFKAQANKDQLQPLFPTIVALTIQNLDPVFGVEIKTQGKIQAGIDQMHRQSADTDANFNLKLNHKLLTKPIPTSLTGTLTNGHQYLYLDNPQLNLKPKLYQRPALKLVNQEELTQQSADFFMQALLGAVCIHLKPHQAICVHVQSLQIKDHLFHFTLQGGPLNSPNTDHDLSDSTGVARV